MKNAISVILITAIVVVTAIFFMKQEGGKTPKEIKNSVITANLPSETKFLVKFSSLEEFYKAIGLNETEIWGKDLTDVIEPMKKEIECNLFSASELKANGVSTDKELGVFSTYMVLSDRKPQGAFTFFLPVSEDSKLKSKILTELKEDGGVTETKDNGITTLSREYDPTTMNFAQVGDYLYFTVGFGEGAGKEELKKVLNAKGHLKENELFAKTTENFSTNETVFMYANTKKFFTDNKVFFEKIFNEASPYGGPKLDIDKYMKYIEGNEASAFSIGLSTKDLTASFQGVIDESSDIAKLYKVTSKTESPIFNVTKKPLFFASSNINISEYLTSMLEMFDMDKAQMDMAFAAAKEETGVDLEDAFLNNTGSNLGVAMYGANEISMGKYNALITLNLKDGKKFAKALDMLIEKIPSDPSTTIKKTDIDGVSAHKITAGMGMVKIYVGVVENDLIITSEKPIFKEVIKGNLSSGFVKDIKAGNVKAAVKGNSLQVMFIDAYEIGELVENLSAMALGFQAALDPEGSEKTRAAFENIVKEIQTLNYIFSDSNLEGDILTSDVVISTNFKKNFGEGLADMVQNIVNEVSSMN